MQIEREGRVNFGDASLSIWEEGIPSEWEARCTWERTFKHQVFKRIIQTLHRLGWSVGPDEDAEKHYKCIAKSSRWCSKGDLKADLKLSGRTITLNMFQNVNAPDRPDHGGRYQNDLEGHMPYLMRLEMERTRRRIRDYLCNVFTGYEFQQPKVGRSARLGLNGPTAMEFLAGCYADSWHFKGDLSTYDISSYNNKSADGGTVTHGARVWTTDYNGRVITGTAYYNINNMWWVISGKYEVTNKASFEIYTSCPESVRVKRNGRRRRSRLEGELASAIKAMNFERAALLRDILFPEPGPLYLIARKDDGLYFRPNYSGYTSDSNDAGKYTRAELKPYFGASELETETLRAVLIAA